MDPLNTLTVEQLIMRLQAFPKDATVIFRLTVDDVATRKTLMLPVTHVCRPDPGVVVLE